jgi:protein involved in polysaccharide export with SLBB domain
MGQGHASWQILNLGKGLGSADFTDDLRLAPHDILYVPRSPIGNVDEFVDLYIRRLLPIQPGIQVPVS